MKLVRQPEQITYGALKGARSVPTTPVEGRGAPRQVVERREAEQFEEPRGRPVPHVGRVGGGPADDRDQPEPHELAEQANKLLSQ